MRHKKKQLVERMARETSSKGVNEVTRNDLETLLNYLVRELNELLTREKSTTDKEEKQKLFNKLCEVQTMYNKFSIALCELI